MPIPVNLHAYTASRLSHRDSFIVAPARCGWYQVLRSNFIASGFPQERLMFPFTDLKITHKMHPVAVESVNRPDEWKIEQGINGAKLPILDQTGTETVKIQPVIWGDLTKDEAAIEAVGNRDELFKRE